MVLSRQHNYLLGTWTKDKGGLTGRNPWRRDPDRIEYEYDSEAEWQEPDGEGEEGESIDGSDGEDDDDELGTSVADSDDGWLVPDGYLSEDEGVDETGAALPAHLDPDHDPGLLLGDRKDKEALRAKPQKKQEKKRQLVVLKTMAIGPLWSIEVSPGKPSWQLYSGSLDLEFNGAQVLPIDPMADLVPPFPTHPAKDLELLPEMLDAIRSEPKDASVEDIISRMAARFKNLPKRIFERLIHLSRPSTDSHLSKAEAVMQTEELMDVDGPHE